MTSPNHIVGGIAITGISLSFWDINIFSNSTYLSLCIFSSLLPDIDHTKSIIGKAFFPLAKYLDIKFGHRTITHSVTLLLPLFLIFLFVELNLINPYFNRSGIDYSLIFFFAFLSHLILDMLTVQGIPLFYPFMKNPCVIPANPTLRFRSGNIKSEAIALFIFTFVLFTSYDLFQNGFWTTYNRSFGTIKHAFREFKDSENLVQVTYSFTFNGEEKTGKGLILEASENKVEILSNRQILVIDSEDLRFKNINILPSKTEHKYIVKDLNLFQLTLNELNDTLNKKIVSGKVLSSTKFLVNNFIANKGNAELNKSVSPRFSFIESDSIQNEVLKTIELKEAKLKEIQIENFNEKMKFEKLKNQLSKAEIDLKNSENLYQKNKFEKLIIQKKKEIVNFELNLINTDLIEKEISLLRTELTKTQLHYFTADLKSYEIPSPLENFPN